MKEIFKAKLITEGKDQGNWTIRRHTDSRSVKSLSGHLVEISNGTCRGFTDDRRKVRFAQTHRAICAR